ARNPDDAAIQTQYADYLVTARQFDAALEHYRLALARQPNSPTANYGIAMALVAKGGTTNTTEAQRILETSLASNPADAPTNEALGDLLVDALHELALPTAQRLYEQALATDPTRANAAIGLSKIYLTQADGRPERLVAAGTVLVKPIKAHKDNAGLHLQLAKV